MVSPRHKARLTPLLANVQHYNKFFCQVCMLQGALRTIVFFIFNGLGVEVQQGLQVTCTLNVTTFNDARKRFCEALQLHQGPPWTQLIG